MTHAHPRINTPLAIIGMACRLPGADNLDQFWQLLAQGRSAVIDLPPEHLNRDDCYDPRRGIVGKSYSTLAALTSRRPFDHNACPIPAQLAAKADGVHLAMCEVAAEACRHAGLDPFCMPRRNTGVYVGHTRGSRLAGDYVYATCVEESAQLLRQVEALRSVPGPEQEELIRRIVERVRKEHPRSAVEGRDVSTHMIGGLISKAFGLNGPFMAINAACASSLQAVLLAARALQMGHIEMAIVGGASYYRSDTLVLFSQAQSVSATGSRPFDADADGLILGEGYAAIVVKTLPQAVADGDRVLAVIRGLGLSSDGQGKSLWAPRREGQIQAIERAYAGGLEMDRLQYVEAHATSTPLGDATELNALAEVLHGQLPPGAKILIGSVKANIGHTLETAGLASLVKTVLAMQHGIVPPAINIRRLNPKIDWERLPLRVPLEPTPWPDSADGHPRRAAVNAFGIGGLNMHVVLDHEPVPARAMLRAPERPSERAAPVPAADQSVAVIGVGCIFPGARTIAAFWDLLASGRDPKCLAPADRWRADLACKPGPPQAYRSPTALGGFVTDFHYDWRAHKVPPKQVASADPLQFMLLDAADEALRDSGYDRKPFARARTGVLVGTVVGSDFASQLQMGLRLPDFQRTLAQELRDRGVPEESIAEAGQQFARLLLERWPALLDETGSFSTSTLASRITKTYDLMGGGAAIDSGGVSAATALDASVDLLCAGDCDMIFCAAGQRRMGLPAYEALAQEGTLAANEKPRSPLDADAGGVVPGEGVGVLLLKRLSDARRDGDRIRAVIRGIGAAHDGSWAEGCELAVERSLKTAGIRPEEIAILEMDGSGLPQRNQEVLRALAKVYEGGHREQPLLVGSLIGQIGHTEGSSAMASLLKASLSLEHGEMPATVGLESPARALTANPATICAATAPTPLRRGDGRNPLAAVHACSKGLAYHVVLENGGPLPVGAVSPQSAAHHSIADAAREVSFEAVQKPAGISGDAKPRDQWRILRLGAASLAELTGKLVHATARCESTFAEALASRFTAADRVRLAIAADSPAALEPKLQMTLEQVQKPGTRELLEQHGIFCREAGQRRPRVAFLFAGQGARYAGMLRELVRDVPAAAAALEEIDPALVRGGYPTFAEMAWAEETASAQELWFPQVSVLAADLIVYAALAEFGIRPDVLSGHSYGEYAALVAAGVWDFEQALRITRARCDAIQSAPSAGGGMLTVTAPAEVVEHFAAQIQGNVYAANYNAPDQIVVAGRREALSELAALLEAEAYRVQWLPVWAPFHSPILEPATGPVRRALHREEICPPRVPFLSSVTNRYAAEAHEIRANLVAQLVTPLHYVDLIRRLASEDETVLVEVGPKQVLTRLHRQILADRDVAAIASDNPKRPGVEPLYRVRALLECSGAVNERAPFSLSAIPAVARAAAPAAGKGQLLQFDATARRRERKRRAADLAGTSSPLTGGEKGEPTTAPRPVELPQSVLAEPAAVEASLAPSPTLVTPQPEPPKTGAQPVAESGGVQLESFLINFVVEQTGYPPEVVELDADLEADLGVDSIKKAQLFGELQEYFDVKPSEDLTLDAFPTLRHVLNFLQGTPTKVPLAEAPPEAACAGGKAAGAQVHAALGLAPAVPLAPLTASSPSDSIEPAEWPPGALASAEGVPLAVGKAAGMAAGPDSSQLESFLINFVVEQTGYPPEVVELDADLEADLGVDSIKKAQLFGELQEYFDVKPSEDLTLDDFPTLRHVLEFLRGAPTKAPPAVVQPSDQEAETPVVAVAATPRVDGPAPAPQSDPGDLSALAPLNITRLRGTPYEMGQQHGQARAEEIRRILRRYADLAGPARETSPKLERDDLDPDALFGPDELDELQGLADAVGVPLDNMIAHQVLQFPDSGAGCVHFAVAAGRDLGAGLIHAANEDLPLSLSLRDCLSRVVQARYPVRGIAHLTFSVAGIVGGLNGINACGLAVTSAMLLDCPSRNGTARGCLHSVIVKLLLEEAADIDSALAILRRLAKRGAWGICLSHHPSQRLCYLEYDGESLQIRHESTLAAANHSLLFPSRAEAPGHSRHRLTSLEEMLRRRSPEGLAAREAQETLRSRYDPARGRGTAHPTMNTLCRVDNQISIVMEPQRGRVWATSGPLGSDDPDRFYCLPIGSLLGTGRTPLSLVPGGNPVLHESRAGAEVKGERAEPLEPPCVAERFVMRMIPVPLRPDLPAAPAWQGPVLIVGRNLSAQALRVRLEAGGALVREIPSDDLDAAIAAFDRIWQEGPVPHLFLMTGRDGIATDPYDEAVWQERRLRGVLLPFFLCQRWIERVSQAQMLDRCTLVAATALGGDLGFSGRAYAVEGGALTGLVKGLYIELAVLRHHQGLLVKAIDAPIEEPPDLLAENICRELACGTRDYEVAYVQGERRLQRAVPEVAPPPSAEIRRGGTWIVTGGARGITAACALELGRRHGLKLHLLGSSPPPEIDPAWRDLSAEAMKALRASIMAQARARGEAAPAVWARVEKAIEIDRSLRLLADAGVQATYHACNVCDRAALGSVLERVRRADGPIDGILHGAGIDQACRFENKSREGVLATVGAKVDGAANLIALTRHDPVRFFVGFGSVAGRLGGNGQTDYCAASDMLCKLVGWYGKERPGCRAVGFHWTAWDEVGMASRPATKATLRLVNRQLIPLREGVGHLLRELAAGAPEGEVLIVDREYYEKFYRGDGAAKGPSGVPGEGSPAAAGPSTASAADPAPGGAAAPTAAMPTPDEPANAMLEPASPAASAAASRVCQRYVLRMFDAPLAEPKAAPPAFDGPALILGDNPSATALCQRLAGLGVDVVRLPVGDDPGTSIAAIEDLWRSRPAKHLFLMTARDQDAQVSNGPAWQRRRTRGILLPYLVSQRWCELLSALPSRAGSALVAVTALGGEFGLAGHVAAPEGGAMTGLLKSLHIEETRRPQRELRLKIIDAPLDEEPALLAEAICRELAADRPEIEVGWSKGRRRVLRPTLEAVGSFAGSRPPFKETWIVTGGGRGVTAFVALQLARRYGLKLHLIGRSPHPQEHAPWRHYSEQELKRFKASLAQQAITAGRMPDDEWEAVQNDIEIHDTLRKFALAGVEARYHSCDVSDWDAMARLLDQIRETHGPIQGVLHGAGYGKSARFDKKRLEHVRRTIDAKVGGAAALMALTRQDPLRWFVAFGSIAGRFGGNGLTDYAAANDMLAKLIDWFRSERPQCASACFHWDSWAGVGMAMKPKSLVGAKSVLKLDFMPPEEGLAHLLAEIEAGLPECETLITNGQFQRTFYPSQTTRAPSEPCGSAAPDPGPRLEGGNLPQHPPPPCRRPSPVKEAGNRPTVTNRPLVDRWHDAEAGQGMVAEMRLDPIGDVFLREHRLRDRPLLPGVISMEAIVEAAALYDSGRTVAALEEVHFHRSMTFYTDAPVDARVEVLPAERGVRCTLASDFRARDGRLVERNRVFATGFVELAEKRPDIAAAPSGRPADWHPSQYREGRLIHHGPPFRCLAGYAHRKTAGWGRIAASSPADLAGTRPEAGWIIPAAALDACLVACGHYLSVEFRSALEIPHKFDRLCLGRLPRVGETCLVELQFRHRDSRHSRFDFTLFGDDDAVILQAEGYQTVRIAQGAR